MYVNLEYVVVGLILCATSVATTDVQMLFTRYANQSMVAASPVDVLTVTRARGCHFHCLNRPGCVALAVSGTSCSLYDNYVTDPKTQLQNQQGSVVYSYFNYSDYAQDRTVPTETIDPIDPIDIVSVSLDMSTTHNVGNANFFPQLAATRGGQVVKWEVRCAAEGTVWLAMWRRVPDTLMDIQLIGKHQVTVSPEMVNDIVTYEVPEGEEFTVEAGDFVGFHYDASNKALVQDIKAVDRPDLTIGVGYWLGRFDASVGTVITMNSAVARDPERVGVIAVHILV